MFLPVLAAELAYGFHIHHLSAGGSLRRVAALLVYGQLDFLLGALLRPLPGERCGAEFGLVNGLLTEGAALVSAVEGVQSWTRTIRTGTPTRYGTTVPSRRRCRAGC
ncbi:hypothetical protein MKK65_14125 [Methylobacterium sp. J-001]|uniref:hypothetical protein n=1 Tax=Methylobacterium sp. J-001 TaxID=2836609 RepID=UPI001FB87722|nr:hypothetical protein [Methylobacterium sp. J-001]MCJ2117688.1 hypothetical protein [Methylobacterium sp. J-001]